MKKFTKKNVITLSFITVIILVVAAISFKTGNNFISNTVGTVVSPVQSICAKAVTGTKKWAGNIINAGKNAKEATKLKKEVAELNDQIRMLEGYKAENDKLRSMLDLKETRTEIKSIGANVIGKKTDEMNSVITLDKGSLSGITKKSVVYVPEGLVGVVTEVGANYCKVKTIFDTESSVSAICLRSGDMGIVEPSGFLANSGKCSMNYIDRSAKTVVGDIVETSGTGGIFPRGIVIGKITEIKEDARNLTLSAIIETEVNIYKLDSVLISVE